MTLQSFGSQQIESADEAFVKFGRFLNNYKKLGMKNEFKNVYNNYQTKEGHNCWNFLLYFVDLFLDEKKGKLNPKDYLSS